MPIGVLEGLVMARGDDIEERMIDFAVRVVKLCDSLPKRASARHIADQLLRSGTSPAANYAEARRAESTRDFLHKLKICLKELNETRVWLLIITRSEILPTNRMEPIISECTELCKIISASIRTSSAREHHS